MVAASKSQGDGGSEAGSMTEYHYEPEELAECWSLSADTISRMFEHEAGVLVYQRKRSGSKQRYRTLRIPESVALRVYRRMTNPN